MLPSEAIFLIELLGVSDERIVLGNVWFVLFSIIYFTSLFILEFEYKKSIYLKITF